MPDSGSKAVADEIPSSPADTSIVVAQSTENKSDAKEGEGDVGKDNEDLQAVVRARVCVCVCMSVAGD